MLAKCRCGERVYANEAEARKAEPNGLHKCPTCHTFAVDHNWQWNGDPDCNRCGECDIRSGSHG